MNRNKKLSPRVGNKPMRLDVESPKISKTNPKTSPRTLKSISKKAIKPKNDHFTLLDQKPID